MSVRGRQELLLVDGLRFIYRGSSALYSPVLKRIMSQTGVLAHDIHMEADSDVSERGPWVN